MIFQELKENIDSSISKCRKQISIHENKEEKKAKYVDGRLKEMEKKITRFELDERERERKEQESAWRKQMEWEVEKEMEREQDKKREQERGEERLRERERDRVKNRYRRF